MNHFRAAFGMGDSPCFELMQGPCMVKEFHDWAAVQRGLHSLHSPLPGYCLVASVSVHTVVMTTKRGLDKR
jgi:hypothetical protein